MTTVDKPSSDIIASLYDAHVKDSFAENLFRNILVQKLTQGKGWKEYTKTLYSLTWAGLPCQVFIMGKTRSACALLLIVDNQTIYNQPSTMTVKWRIFKNVLGYFNTKNAYDTPLDGESQMKNETTGEFMDRVIGEIEYAIANFKK